MVTNAGRFKCCSCCASGNTERCAFSDGPRDDHASPCYKCEPEAYEAFTRTHVDPEGSDVPF